MCVCMCVTAKCSWPRQCVSLCVSVCVCVRERVSVCVCVCLHACLYTQQFANSSCKYMFVSEREHTVDVKNLGLVGRTCFWLHASVSGCYTGRRQQKKGQLVKSPSVLLFFLLASKQITVSRGITMTTISPGRLFPLLFVAVEMHHRLLHPQNKNCH